MLFPSPVFLSIFLPTAVGLCAIFRAPRLRNALLIVLSVAFYAWGGGWNAALLIVSALFNWAISFGYLSASRTRSRLTTAAAVAFNIGVLGWFKYAGFVVRGLNILLNVLLNVLLKGADPIAIPEPAAALPLGISFFTFQALSYTLDVRAGRAEPCRNPLDLILYICLFPQLIAGPILNWRDAAAQLKVNKMSWPSAAVGLRVFACGLAQKTLLADELAKLANAAFDCPADARSAPLAWIGAVAYTLQIYLDFSGYSRMAIGLGKMLGFDFPENFRMPLAARSMGDFWKRWHITLTKWFTQYIYIPLGGNRGGRARTLRNVAVVFICTGIWHGAAWTFILWGLWNGLFVILERANWIRADRMPRPLAHIYVLMIVIIGFALFRSSDLAKAGEYIVSMFDFHALNYVRVSRLIEPLNIKAIASLAIGILVSVPVAGVRNDARGGWRKYAAGFASAALIAWSYAAIIASGHHPFIYFQF